MPGASAGELPTRDYGSAPSAEVIAALKPSSVTGHHVLIVFSEDERVRDVVQAAANAAFASGIRLTGVGFAAGDPGHQDEVVHLHDGEVVESILTGDIDPRGEGIQRHLELVQTQHLKEVAAKLKTNQKRLEQLDRHQVALRRHLETLE